jgi:DNA-binding NtrC family response regulator
VLVAGSGDVPSLDLDHRLRSVGVRVDRVEDMVSALGRVEEKEAYDAMVLDRRLLGGEADALLRAIVKLKPETGLVVLTDESEADRPAVEHAVTVPFDASPDTILEALPRTRALAGRALVSGRVG